MSKHKNGSTRALARKRKERVLYRARKKARLLAVTPEPEWKKWPDACHPSHVTRVSDASSFDEICTLCGARDITGGGWGSLRMPCKEVKK